MFYLELAFPDAPFTFEDEFELNITLGVYYELFPLFLATYIWDIGVSL